MLPILDISGLLVQSGFPNSVSELQQSEGFNGVFIGEGG